MNKTNSNNSIIELFGKERVENYGYGIHQNVSGTCKNKELYKGG
jgi:hypothetical protein